MYQALYRKWRPKVFEDVVSQDHIVETLKNQIANNKIAHAYLFCGSRGTGKTSTAKIFARAVNCLNPINGNPCNECEACKAMLSGSTFDVVEMDGASNRKIDDIRNVIDEVVYAPGDVKYKVYILDEVHMLTTEAFNALLKTLEEPPGYVIFILATTEFHKVPATIVSRCQKFDFKRITYKDTAKRLEQVAREDNINITPAAVNLLAKAAEGSLRDGLSKLDQCLALGIDNIDYKDVANVIGASDPEYLENLCEAIIDENLPEALSLLNKGVNLGMNVLRLFTDVADYMRDVMIVKTAGDVSMIMNTADEVIAKYRELSEKVPLNRILNIIEVLFDSQNKAKYLPSPQIAFETALLKISAKQTDRDLDMILNRLEALEEKFARGITVTTAPVSQPAINVQTQTEPEIVPEPESAPEPEENIEPETVPESEQQNEPEEEYEYPYSDDEYSDDYSGYESYLNSMELENQPDINVYGELSSEETPVSEIPEIEEQASNETVSEEISQPEPEKIAYDADSEAVIKEIISDKDGFIKSIESKDFGFANIVSMAEFTMENGFLTLVFALKSYGDMAINNGYDKFIAESVKKKYGCAITVKIKSDEDAVLEEKNTEDPLDSLIGFMEDNQITFNLE